MSLRACFKPVHDICLTPSDRPSSDTDGLGKGVLGHRFVDSATAQACRAFNFRSAKYLYRHLYLLCSVAERRNGKSGTAVKAFVVIFF